MGLFVVAPRDFCHHAVNAADAFWWRHFCELSWDFAKFCQLIQFCEGEVAEAKVPAHELALAVLGDDIGLCVLLDRKRWVKG